MTAPVRIRPTVTANPLLPSLDYAALVAAGFVIPEFEAGAAEDYCFDRGDDAGLRNRIAGGALTQPSGAAPITYDDAYLTIPSGTTGLITRTLDQATFTMAAIVKRPANASTGKVLPLIGCERPDTVPPTGIGIYINQTGSLIGRGRNSTAQGVLSLAAIPVGSWMFVALVSNPEQNRVFIGAATPLTTTWTYAHDQNGLALGLGKVRTMGSLYEERALDFHRATVWTAPLSLDELVAAYRRAKVVAERRGITVV